MTELISNRSKIAGLIETYRTKDPRLVQILETLSSDLHNTIVTVSPIQSAIDGLGLTDVEPPSNITIVTVTLLAQNIQLAWGASTGALLYEIREGTDWDTATFVLKTSSLSAALNPRVIGTYDLLIKAISRTNVYSLAAFAFQIVVPALGSITLSASTIDNNVLLSWTIPTSSFQIEGYRLYRDSIQFAEIKSNFLVRFEAAAGTYFFEVEAVDIAGNVSPKGSISISVRTPPDYILQNQRVVDLSDLTLVNALYDPPFILACIDDIETYQQHFDNKAWGDPDDQITAGYDYWIQDNLLSGYVLDEHDYGSLITNTVAIVDYIKETFAGTGDVSITVKLSWSDDNITWSPESVGSSQFIASLRYLRTKLEFSAANDDSMIKLSKVTVNLSVKRELDSGSVLALETDIEGTLVMFNKTFKDIDSLTATADSLTPITVITDFQDVPNPVSFRVLAFDSAGIRVTHLVDWKARGVVA